MFGASRSSSAAETVDQPGHVVEMMGDDEITDLNVVAFESLTQIGMESGVLFQRIAGPVGPFIDDAQMKGRLRAGVMCPCPGTKSQTDQQEPEPVGDKVRTRSPVHCKAPCFDPLTWTDSL